MATSTTNFGLTKPAYNEAADVAVINGNMDTVDTVMGVNRNLAKGAQAGLAIVADGDTHAAITAGQYVYVRNNTHSLAEGLYVASANVSANGNITGSNMTAVSSGGLNALNSKLSNLTYYGALQSKSVSLNQTSGTILVADFDDLTAPTVSGKTFIGYVGFIESYRASVLGFGGKRCYYLISAPTSANVEVKVYPVYINE